MFATFILMLLAPAEVGGGAGSGTAAPPAAPSAPSSTPASTPASAPGTGSTPPAAPSGTPPSQGTPPAVDPNASDPAYGNWKALRESLETERTRASTFEKQTQQFTTIKNSSQGLARSLGYTDQDFEDAFASDPIQTIAILKQEAAAATQRQGQQAPPNGQEDLSRQIRELIRNETAPMTEQVNRQITETAFAKYETILTDTIKSDPILQNASPKVHELVKDYIGEYFATQPTILLNMKMKGDFSTVPEIVKYISGRLHGAFTEWQQASSQTSGGMPRTVTFQGTSRPNGKAKPSLDDIINDPSVLGPQYKE